MAVVPRAAIRRSSSNLADGRFLFALCNFSTQTFGRFALKARLEQKPSEGYALSSYRQMRPRHEPVEVKRLVSFYE
jgi:hypothetical protein